MNKLIINVPEVPNMRIYGDMREAYIKDGSVTEEKLAAASVSAEKIKDGAVTGGKLSEELKGKINNSENHIANKENPHEVTKTQVGLGNVDNTSDEGKPISAATQAALDLKADKTDIPTKTSELQNDSGFALVSEIPTKLSELENDSGYAKETDVDTKSSEIVNTASGKMVAFHDSDDAHFKDIEISDTTNTDVTVNVYGKNLFGYISPVMANGTVIESFENGAIVQGNQRPETTDTGAYSRGWFRSGYTSASANCPALFKGQHITISADITLIEIGNAPDPYLFGISVYARTPANINYLIGAPTLDQTIGEKQRISASAIIGNGANGEIFYPVFNVNSNKIKIENIQIEINSAATEYEDYKSQSVNLTLPLTDTQKDKFKALVTYKGTTTVSNDKNIDMSVSYKADTKLYIDNKFNELQNAIISLGGNV